MIRPVILLEINEVPWKLVDRFRNDPRLPNLRRFFELSRTFTTHAVDSGELSPWVTWPSFHRGMSGLEHQVQFLGQNPESFKGTPIWQEFIKRGHSIGVCGSLQSWPPIYPGENGFYIPDTFAHDDSCIPSALNVFQRFNLEQVRENGRVLRPRSLLSAHSIDVILAAKKMGLRLKTLKHILGHLVHEQFDHNLVFRRPTFQAVILWDIFHKLFKIESPPTFSTFFTNHVASALHRYWHHVFPSDFGDKYKTEKKVHFKTIYFAVKILDQILGEALNYQAKNKHLILVFASSMGQGATEWKRADGYSFLISDIGRFLNIACITAADVRMLPTMVPQIAFEMKSDCFFSEIKKSFEACRTISGEPIFFVKSILNSVSISVRTPTTTDIAGGYLIRDNRKISWKDAGIQVEKVGPATAYHIPEGVMAIVDNVSKPSNDRRPILASQVKEFLMKEAGL